MPPSWRSCPSIIIIVPLFFLSEVSCLDDKLCADSMVTYISDIQPLRLGTGSFVIIKSHSQGEAADRLLYSSADDCPALSKALGLNLSF